MISYFVHKTIGINTFAAPRTSYEVYNVAKKRENNTNLGLWLLCSRINHDCMANCRGSYIGDMHIIRACEDLAADTELRISYRDIPPTATYKETQEIVGNWGFVCSCSWCLDRKSTSTKTLATRKAVLKNINDIIRVADKSEGHDLELLTEISMLIDQADKTYPNRPGIVKPELMTGYFSLGGLLIMRGEARLGLEAILKALETIGCEIVACPPQGGAGQRKFEIIRWGHLHISGLMAFEYLHLAYSMIAPELCPRVKHYAKIIYCVYNGSDIGFEKTYAKLTS